MILLRSAAFNLLFFGVTFVLALLATVLRWFMADTELRMAVLWARILVAMLRVVCGIRLEVSGMNNIPPGAALIASRHQSAFDTFVWMTLVPRCCYVLKRELLRIPLFGRLILGARMIAVDRAGGGRALRAMLQDAETAVAEGRQIVIFPEGTRSEPGTLLNLQPGIAALAARTGLSVIPVSTDSGRCWGRRAFRKQPGVIHIVIGPAIAGGTGRVELMQRLHDGIGLLDGLSHGSGEDDQPGDNSVRGSCPQL